MKTLADFKRAMQPGTQWLRKYANDETYETRTVSKLCSDHVYVITNEGKESRLDFPKSCNFEINDKGEAEIYFPSTYTYVGLEEIEIPRRLILTYKQI